MATARRCELHHHDCTVYDLMDISVCLVTIYCCISGVVGSALFVPLGSCFSSTLSLCCSIAVHTVEWLFFLFSLLVF
ncbi:hypothetical protein LXA43DRAFT_398560 [Ganoderma leucocontextum]|nr:hypothetical protein LXA43DRAFT_398560 [Ganoderma leucocontextum]